ncbi:MAG: hypothetical protein PVH00_10220 [Gemmatimonadota bacterium]
MPAACRRAIVIVRSSRVAALSLLVGGGGCGVTDPYTSTMELPEDPGAIVAAAGTIAPESGLVWSRDGGQLTFEREDRTLTSLDIESGAITERDGPRDEYDEVSAAFAGDALYFLADRHDGLRAAWRLPAAGPAVRLTDRASGSQPVVPADGTLVLGGPGDALVAFIASPDSLFLFEPATGDRRFIAPDCARAVAFSPQGGRLLCKRSTEGTYGIFDLADGSVSPISLAPSENQSVLLRTRWARGGDTIRSLYRTLSRFRLRNAETGEAHSLWLPIVSGGVREVDFFNWSWSADGRHFVFWIHECLKLDRVGGCERGQSVLYGVDIVDNTGGPVAVVKGTRGGEQVALSPDGTRVAFVFLGRLHLQVLP